MAFIIVICHYGFGRHVFYLSQSQLSHAVKYQHFAILSNILSTTFARISICMFLLSIFKIDRRWRGGLLALITFLVVSTIPIVVIIFAQCRPIRKLWYPQTPGQCWRPEALIRAGNYQGGKASLTAWYHRVLLLF